MHAAVTLNPGSCWHHEGEAHLQNGVLVEGLDNSNECFVRTSHVLMGLNIANLSYMWMAHFYMANIEVSY